MHSRQVQFGKQKMRIEKRLTSKPSRSYTYRLYHQLDLVVQCRPSRSLTITKYLRSCKTACLQRLRPRYLTMDRSTHMRSITQHISMSRITVCTCQPAHHKSIHRRGCHQARWFILRLWAILPSWRMVSLLHNTSQPKGDQHLCKCVSILAPRSSCILNLGN
jgi:hypothetical protein